MLYQDSSRIFPGLLQFTVSLRVTYVLELMKARTPCRQVLARSGSKRMLGYLYL